MKIITAKRIYTLNEAFTIAEAIVVDGNEIISVGSLTEMQRVAGPHAELIDLGERIVTPGFIDAHLHLSFAAIYQGAIDCSIASSIDELKIKLQEGSSTQTPGSWVVGFGYDELKLRERRHPTRHDLDVLFPDRPVFLMHFSCHEGVANSKALAIAQIGRSTKDPAGGRIAREKKGEPTGHLMEDAMGPIERIATNELMVRDEKMFLERLKSYEQMLFSFGVTRIADLVVPPAVEAMYRALHQEKLLTIPIVMMPVGANGYLHPPLDRVDGAKSGEGDETLRVGPMKLFFDGANQCAVCFSIGQSFRAGIEFAKRFVRDRSFSFMKDMRMGSMRLGRDLHIHSGFCYYPTHEEARETARKISERGFGVAVHALGNEAIRMAAKALDRLPHPDKFPPRIEHAVFLEKETAKRIGDSGITLVMQPHFISHFGNGSVPPISKIAVIGLKTAIDAGCVIAGSSDAPVTPPDPLLGLRSAITRQVGERTFLPEEALSAKQVLEMYTRNAARAIGCFDVTGSIEVGKRADLAVLSLDPCESPIDWDKLHVEETFLAGKRVYSRQHS
jgi:predicted amidohydrolase YtcJ